MDAVSLNEFSWFPKILSRIPTQLTGDNEQGSGVHSHLYEQHITYIQMQV